MDNTIVEDFNDDLNLDCLFVEDEPYPFHPQVIKSTKEVDAVVYRGYHYNFKRANEKEKSKFYKCREFFKDDKGKRKSVLAQSKFTMI